MNVATLFLVCILGLSEGFVDKTVIQWLKDDGGFTSLVTALKTAGLETALSGPGPFTIFAPTDAAFSRLGTKNLNKLLQNPLQLSLILKYHVLNEFLVAPMIKGRTTKDTAEGGRLIVEPINGIFINTSYEAPYCVPVFCQGWNSVIYNLMISQISEALWDTDTILKGLVVNNYAKVDISNEDIVVNNGVIHPISDVLLPEHLPTFTIAQYLLQDDREFIDLSLAIHFANLTSLLDGGEYTLFAPLISMNPNVNASANNIPDRLLDPNTPNAQAVYAAILKYHIVKGTVLSNQLSDGQTLTTLYGSTLTVHIDSAGVRINNASIIQPDILCLNGAIHSINGRLIPQDIASTIRG